MTTVGIREVRQRISALLEDVKKGHEILITDRGRPVARLAPPQIRSGKPFPGLAGFRKTIKYKGPPLSEGIIEEREDSI